MLTELQMQNRATARKAFIAGVWQEVEPVGSAWRTGPEGASLNDWQGND